MICYLYIVNLSCVTCLTGSWHPHEKNKVLTSSVDGTLRVWDIEQEKQNLSVIKVDLLGFLEF